MIEVHVPGWRRLQLANLLLDANGTLALDSQLLPGVAERIEELARKLDIALVTADTHGRAAELAETLNIRLLRIEPGSEAAQKRVYAEQVGADRTVAIGNGANDAAMLEVAALGIAVLGGEGLAADARGSADIVCPSIQAALDLLLYPSRLIATLRR
jgi:P-type E1-E2 ATPase